jgi:hypothetical protein
MKRSDEYSGVSFCVRLCLLACYGACAIRVANKLKLRSTGHFHVIGGRGGGGAAPGRRGRFVTRHISSFTLVSDGYIFAIPIARIIFDLTPFVVCAFVMAFV